MKSTRPYFILSLFVLLLFACSGGEKEAAEDASDAQTQETAEKSDQEKSPAELMQEAQKKMQAFSEKNGEKTEVINFRELKEMLPKSLAGMTQENTGGQTAGAMGFKVSTAEGTYRDGDEVLEVTINDAGGVPQFAMGAAAWANIEIDKEDQNGFERTTTIDGHKAFIKHNKRSNKSEISLFVQDRFMVQLEGKNMDVDRLMKVVNELDMDELAKKAG